VITERVLLLTIFGVALVVTGLSLLVSVAVH
jgi:hypothetical protein